MHELSVTQSLLDLALDHATRAGAARVTDLYLAIGGLSSILDESVRFYWDLIAEGTICTGANLHFQRIPARLECRGCGTVYEIRRELTACPACLGGDVRVVQGDEFRLESIGITTQAEEFA